MHLIFLGTASCFPTPSRGVSCLAVRHDDGHVWLFDCGEASQIQVQKSCVKMGRINKIFITHLHGDHLYGLPGLLCSLGNKVGERKEDIMDDNVNDEVDNFVLDIYGPLGLRKFIKNTLELARSPLPYRYNIFELVPEDWQYPEDWNDWPVEHRLELSEAKMPQEASHTEIKSKDGVWDVINSKSVKVEAGAIKHRIPSFGYVITEADQPGRLDVEKLKSLGIIPGPVYAKLKNGESITLSDGKSLDACEVLGPKKRGRKLSILGDTNNTDNIIPIALNSDVLVHEATMQNSLEEKAIEFGHSTPRMACACATKILCRYLILNHLSPRYRPITDTDDKDITASIILNEAKEYLSENNCNCEVLVAEDFFEFKIPKNI